MGAQLLLFLELPTPHFTLLPPLNLNKSLNTSTTNSILRCNSTGSHRTGRQFRFDPRNSIDDDDEFEFSSATKQRIWWSDFNYYDDVWDFDEDDEFWVGGSEKLVARDQFVVPDESGLGEEAGVVMHSSAGPLLLSMIIFSLFIISMVILACGDDNSEKPSFRRGRAAEAVASTVCGSCGGDGGCGSGAG